MRVSCVIWSFQLHRIVGLHSLSQKQNLIMNVLPSEHFLTLSNDLENASEGLYERRAGGGESQKRKEK